MARYRVWSARGEEREARYDWLVESATASLGRPSDVWTALDCGLVSVAVDWAGRLKSAGAYGCSGARS